MVVVVVGVFPIFFVFLTKSISSARGQNRGTEEEEEEAADESLLLLLDNIDLDGGGVVRFFSIKSTHGRSVLAVEVAGEVVVVQLVVEGFTTTAPPCILQSLR